MQLQLFTIALLALALVSASADSPAEADAAASRSAAACASTESNTVTQLIPGETTPPEALSSLQNLFKVFTKSVKGVYSRTRTRDTFSFTCCIV